jgi:hypothetical protein
MEWKNFKGLTWYLAFCLAVISFYGYSQVVGWKWINTTKKETNKRDHNTYRYYHK